MRTFRAGVMSVLVSGVVGALVLSACSSSSTGGTPQGGGSGASSSAGSPAPSFSSGSSAVPVGPQEFLSAADVTHDGFATRLSAVKQNKTSSASAQRKVFDCLALTTVLRPVPGTSVKAKGVRVFADAKNAHVIAQVVLHFASPAQAQRYGGVVVQRLAACPHPKLLLIGTGPEASNGTSEPVTTACDRSAGYTAVATRQLRNRSNSVVVSTLLVAAGPVFSLALLFGPLASNNPTMRSKVADALCARVRG